MATGDTFSHLLFLYTTGISTAGKVRHVSYMMLQIFVSVCMAPQTEQNWKKYSKQF